MYKKYLKQGRYQARGFSLIEVLVSVAIFAIVVTMSVGTLIVLIDANGKAQNTQAVINNVAFILDSMVRDIRTGYFYYCGDNPAASVFTTNNRTERDCTAGESTFVFTESGGSLSGAAGGRVGFRLNNNAIERKVGNGPWQVMTSPDVVIDTFNFIVTGTGANNNVSPLVSIYISGSAGDVVGTESAFTLQTTLTQQTLDL